MVYIYEYIYNQRLEQFQKYLQMNRGKSHAKASNLHETMSKKTLGSKLSRPKKSKQQHTPKKHPISHPNHPLLNELVEAWCQRLPKDTSLCLRLKQQLEKEVKIKMILHNNDNPSKHQNLKNMIEYLNQEQVKIVTELKTRYDGEEQNNIRQGVWKLYDWVVGEDNHQREKNVKNMTEVLTLIRRQFDEQAKVIRLIFQSLENLNSETPPTYAELLASIESMSQSNTDTKKLKQVNAQLLKKQLELEKENLRLCKQMQKLEEQFQYLVEEKLKLEDRIQAIREREQELKEVVSTMKESFVDKIVFVNEDVNDLTTGMDKLKQELQQQFCNFSQYLQKMQEQLTFSTISDEKQKQYIEQLECMSLSYENRMSSMTEEYEGVIIKLEEQVTAKQIEINRYLKILQEVKQKQEKEEQQLKNLNEKTEKLENQLENYKAKQLQQEQQHLRKQKTWQQGEKQLEKKLQFVKETIIQKQKAILSYQQQESKNEKDQSLIHTYQHQLHLKEEQIERHINSIENLKAEICVLNKNKLPQHEIMSYQDQLSSVQQVLSFQTIQIKNLTEKKKQKQLQITSLQGSLNEKEEQMIRIKAQSEEKVKQCLEQCERECEKYGINITAQYQKLQQFYDISNLNNKLQKATSQLFQIKNQISKKILSKPYSIQEQQKYLLKAKILGLKNEIQTLKKDSIGLSESISYNPTIQALEPIIQSLVSPLLEKIKYYQLLQGLMQEFAGRKVCIDWQRKIGEADIQERQKLIFYRSKIGEIQGQLQVKIQENREVQELRSTEQQFPLVQTSSISLSDEISLSLPLEELLDQSNIFEEVVCVKRELIQCIQENKKLRREEQQSPEFNIFDF